MNPSFLDSLDAICSGRLPAGSSNARTLGIALLADVLIELRAIREVLEMGVDDTAPEAEDYPEETPTPDLLTGTVKVLRERVMACSDVDVLEYALAAETSRPKPRSTLQACLTQRIQQLTN
tara:strand:- start:165 stop:527 length:363 start_codon:yes stop_codon:yes gene_type:complete